MTSVPAIDRFRLVVAESRVDKTPPDTRMADRVDNFNPATVNALLKLTLGAIRPTFGGQLHFRVLYFVP